MKATKVWFLLSLVILIEAATILVVLNDDRRDRVSSLEQRVKALEGSADALRDEISDLSRQVGFAQERFWE